MSPAGGSSPKGVTPPVPLASVPLAEIAHVCAVSTSGSAVGSGTAFAAITCVVPPGACHLDAVATVARLVLWAHRRGIVVRVEGADPAFVALADLCGLRDLLGEAGREPEAGDQR